jgi:hypothetical protein
MATRKSAKKKAVKVGKKTVKKAAKKTAAKKAAKKSAPKKAEKQKTTKKRAAPAAQKKAAAGPAAPVEEAADEPPAESGPSSMDVNMGHVFSLRPRPDTSFRHQDFLTARLQLKDEVYATVQEAAQAVVEKALDLTRGGPQVQPYKPKRH